MATLAGLDGWRPRPPLSRRLGPLLRRSPARALVQRKGGIVGWLGSVPGLVQDYPEAIPGPRGERVAVAYGQRDSDGREHVMLRAFAARI